MMESQRRVATPSTHDNLEALCKLPKQDEPAVLLTEEEKTETMQALFGLELAGMERAGVQRNVGASPGASHDTKGNDLISGVLRLMAPGWSLRSVYTGGPEEQFRWRLIGHTKGPDSSSATDVAHDFSQGLRLALDAMSTGYHFTPMESGTVAEMGRACGWSTTIVLPNVKLCEAGRLVGFQADSRKDHREEHILSLITPATPSPFNRIARLLAGLSYPVTVSLTITRTELTSEQRTAVEATLRRLERGQLILHQPEITPAEGQRSAWRTERVLEHLKAWLNTGLGASLTMSIRADHPLSSSVIRILSREFLPVEEPLRSSPRHGNGQLHNKAATGERGLDLRNCLPDTFLQPSLFPHPDDLRDNAFYRVYPSPALPVESEGLHLGSTASGAKQTPVRISENDRARHMYVVGATGTGKSTLMANMIAQDMKAGKGVCVVDPHGDLAVQVLSHVPEERYDDLVLFNPGDVERAPGLNFLECNGANRDMQAHFLINELIQICHKLYHSECVGPIFESSLRTALLILMDNDLPGVNLTDLPQLFEDKDFRETVKSSCRNQGALDYWHRTLERTSGDWSLTNITAYVTSKFNPFIHSHVVRPIVGQAKSTIRFNEIINEGKILLVNLSKGRLGDYDARLLGMLTLGKVYSAALERANLPQEERAPFSVYVDEFQNLATDTAAHMLAEGRKFGLQMVMANQNIRQLSAHRGVEDVAHTVLGNVGSLLCFRLGPQDAEALKPYFDAGFTPQDLQYLPDFHAAARMLMGNAPAYPFVIATEPFPTCDPGAHLYEAIEASRQRYARSKAEVERELALRPKKISSTDRRSRRKTDL